MPESVASKRCKVNEGSPDISASINPPPTPPQPDSVFHSFQDHAIGFLLLLLAIFQFILATLVTIFEAVFNFFVKLVRVLRFIWNKPQHAKDLFLTSIHLMRVSYDAGLWSWSDAYDILAKQIGLMANTPSSTPQNTAKSTTSLKTAK